MHPLNRLARTTGLLYLGLAVTGAAGFLIVRPRLFVADDAQATLANLVQHETLARLGVVFELLVVLTQALTATWFHRLFRRADPTAAAGIAAFGLINAGVILGSAALLATASRLAQHPDGATAADVQLLYLVSGNLWTVGGLFFGLWLIPMGRCVHRSGWLPPALGWILIGGGVGYVLSTFVAYLVPGATLLADLLTVPASIGEFWMVGYLLIRGLRPAAEGPPRRAAPQSIVN
ncbi:DUF4386 domain-containing protein [Micromonosporaceae bacterium Da 78-11]